MSRKPSPFIYGLLSLFLLASCASGDLKKHLFYTPETPLFSELVSNDIVSRIGKVENWVKTDLDLAGQGGDVYGDHVVIMDNEARTMIKDLQSGETISEFKPIQGDIHPHCNAVSFTKTFFAETDRYPLIYVNAYNAWGLPLGVAYACRLANDDHLQILQIVSLDFVYDGKHWPSSDEHSPYGNFVVDRFDDTLYVYVPDYGIAKTRIYHFALPSFNKPIVTLSAEDALSYSEAPLIPFIQDGYVYHGLLYTLSGFNLEEDGPPGFLSAIDCQTGQIVGGINITAAGLEGEPEAIFPYKGTLYMTLGETTYYLQRA